MDNRLLKTYYAQNPLMEEIYRLANKEQKKQLIEQQQRVLQEKQKYEMKLLEKINEVKRMQPKDLSKIIVPSEIVSKPKNEHELNIKRVDKERDYNPSLIGYWKTRTNQPYKNILKNIDYTKKIENKEDLIIYKINKNDKSELVSELNELQEKIKKQNDDILELFSKDKQDEYKRKFEYNNKYLFRLPYNPKDSSDLKEEYLEEYKKKQEEMEKGKKRIDEIIETLIESKTIVIESLDEYIKNTENIEKDKEIKSEKIKTDMEFLNFESKVKIEIKDEPSKIEPKREEPQKNEPKTEEPKTEEPKKDDKEKYKRRQMIVKMMRK
jgi:hypothetical protein